MPNSHNLKPESLSPPRAYPCIGWLMQSCEHDNYKWIPLYCHKWTCDTCFPIMRARVRRRLLHAQHVAAKTKTPLQFITLTFKEDQTPAQVHLALQHLVQYFRRHHTHFEYARFPEYTERARIHLHIIAFCPLISQKQLSDAWKVASKGSYITDIRHVKDAHHLAAYVTKYLTKGPAAKVTFSRGFPQVFQQYFDQPDDYHPAHFSYLWAPTWAALDIAGSEERLFSPDPVYAHGP